MAFKSDSKRRLYERQILHNLNLDTDFREAYLDCLSEECFSHVASRAAFKTIKECGEIVDGFNTGYILNQDDQDWLKFLRDDAPSRETDWGKLQDYSDYLRFTPAKDDGLSDELEQVLKEEDEKNDIYQPTKKEELVLFVQKHKRQTPSFEEIRAALKLSPQRLSNLLTNDREKGRKSTFRIIKYGRSKYLTLRKGTGLIRSDRVDLDTLNEVKPKCWLPANFHEFIGTDLNGLKQKTFLLYVAETDFGKTEFLINCAVENINRQLNVAYVQHEDDVNGFWWRVARRYLGRRPQDNQEVDTVLRQKGVYNYINLHVCPDRAHIDEFLEELAELNPDLLIYDYMDQEYLETDTPNGHSLIHSIIHSFGKHLIDKGIPIFSAAQMKRKTGSPFVEINSNWLLRANVVLVAKNRPEWKEEGVITEVFIKKNKQGGQKGIHQLQILSDPKSFRILSVSPC